MTGWGRGGGTHTHTHTTMLRRNQSYDEMNSCICPGDLVQSMRNDFNANLVCLHTKDLDPDKPESTFVWERVQHRGHCVKLRPLRLHGKVVTLNQWLVEYHTLTEEMQDHWKEENKRKSLSTAVKELAACIVAKAARDTFPCASPDLNAFCFRNGVLRYDDLGLGPELFFEEGTWRPSLYFFDFDFTWDDTVLPYFDKIVAFQGLSPEQRNALMVQFGRILSKQGNEWQCFLMLYGETGCGKTLLLELMQSFFPLELSWDLDQPMPERWIGTYLSRSHFVYFRDATAVSQSLSCNQLLRLAGNEPVTSELKCRNGATTLSCQNARLMRVGNEGWEVENVWAVKRRCFCVDFPRAVPRSEQDFGLKAKLMGEAGAFAAECLKRFYFEYGRADRFDWHEQEWHRMAMLKYIYTKQSRLVQHALWDALNEGVLVWGGSIPVEAVNGLAIKFQGQSRRLAGPPVYHFTPVTCLGWDRPHSPFGVWVQGDFVNGVSAVRAWW